MDHLMQQNDLRLSCETHQGCVEGNFGWLAFDDRCESGISIQRFPHKRDIWQFRVEEFAVVEIVVPLQRKVRTWQ